MTSPLISKLKLTFGVYELHKWKKIQNNDKFPTFLCMLCFVCDPLTSWIVIITQYITVEKIEWKLLRTWKKKKKQRVVFDSPPKEGSTKDRNPLPANNLPTLLMLLNKKLNYYTLSVVSSSSFFFFFLYYGLPQWISVPQ